MIQNLKMTIQVNVSNKIYIANGLKTSLQLCIYESIVYILISAFSADSKFDYLIPQFQFHRDSEHPKCVDRRPNIFSSLQSKQSEQLTAKLSIKKKSFSLHHHQDRRPVDHAPAMNNNTPPNPT